jgi:hypothetical protein
MSETYGPVRKICLIRHFFGEIFQRPYR